MRVPETGVPWGHFTTLLVLSGKNESLKEVRGGACNVRACVYDLARQQTFGFRQHMSSE